MNAPEQEMLESIHFRENLEGLNKKDREVFICYYIMGYTLEELAKYYKKTPEGVQQDLDRIALILSNEE